jgi:hypothetical protein
MEASSFANNFHPSLYGWCLSQFRASDYLGRLSHRRGRPLGEDLHNIGDRGIQLGIKLERALTAPAPWYIA